MGERLKTQVAVEMDASGMARGAAAAKNELDKLKRSAERTAFATSITAGLQAAQAAYAVVAGLVRALDARVTELMQLGATWSREGVAGKAAEEVAKMQHDQTVGRLMGGASEATSRGNIEAMQRELARTNEHAASLAAGAAYWESIKTDLSSIVGALKDSVLAAVGGDYSSGPFTSMYQATGADAKWEEVFSEILEALKGINISSEAMARGLSSTR